MNILGQDKILNKIDKCTLSTFPHSVIICGKQGGGKHLITQHVSSKFNLELVDITDNLSLDVIESIMLRVEPYLYVIDGTQISVKEENVILKFLEEPPKNSFIIILCTSKAQLLPTVLNRCQVWELQSYDKEVLSQFITKNDNFDLISTIGDTPGKILELQNYKNIDEILSLANKIFDCIGNANFSNILTIPNKLSFDNSEDKFNFNLFVDILSYTIRNKIIADANPKLLEAYKLTNKLYNERYIPHVGLKVLFENYLLNLKYALRS